MSAPAARVAAQLGTSGVRLAADPGGGQRVVVEGRHTSVAEAVRGLFGSAVAELLLVHPAAWPPERVARWVRAHAGVAPAVRPVPAPVAAARHAGRTGGLVVLDVGAGGTEATLLDAGGRVHACRTSPIGGDHLDGVVAGLLGVPPRRARRVREALSLLPECVGLSAEEAARALSRPLRAVVEVLAGLPAAGGLRPVLLVGGVARTPLLAELLDAAGVAPVTVAPRPEAAAVLGALSLPPAPTPPRPRPPVRRMPPPARRRRALRATAAVLTGAAAASGLLALGVATTPPAAAAVPAGVLVQYGYRLDVPVGWEHTGGLPERRRSLLGPVATPRASDLIAVESSPLGYDSAAEPQRAAAELRAAFDAAAAGPAGGLSGYDPSAVVAGRQVTRYRQVQERTVVEWYVVLDGDAQLSVGCRHTAASASAVEAACAVVVASVRRA